MHHSRKTHNAHNETQRRLAKLALKTKGNQSNPKYYRFLRLFDGSVWRIETYQDRYFAWFVYPKCHSSKQYYLDSLEDIARERRHEFYKRKSKSNGPKSTWRYYKKLLHRRWRRKPLKELTFTTKDARGCSQRDFW